MTLKSDAKFDEKLTHDSKNGMRSLVNFNASSGNFESLHFDEIVLSKPSNVLDEKVQKSCVSWQ